MDLISSLIKYDLFLSNIREEKFKSWDPKAIICGFIAKMGIAFTEDEKQLLLQGINFSMFRGSVKYKTKRFLHN